MWQSPAISDESLAELEQDLQWQESFLMFCAHLAKTKQPDEADTKNLSR